MGSAGYITLSRQSGLMREMQIVANNIANATTTGYRQEGLTFSEYIYASPSQSSTSIPRALVRNTSMSQGTLKQTNGSFDFSIEGDGFFLLETPSGGRLTRSGSFSPNAEGNLVSADGYSVLDLGGAPVFIPSGTTDISVSRDGTVSIDGRPLGQIGLYKPRDPKGLVREDGVMFRVDGGIEPADKATVLQGFLEGSNVNAIAQMTRMIEVQRAYEMGQSFLENEDQRIRNAIKTLIQ